MCKISLKIFPFVSSDVDRSRDVQPEQQLMIALRFYACGNMLITVGDFINVSPSTVCNILPRVSLAIANLRCQFIKMPDTRVERGAAAASFYAIREFPRTIGAIDCTHVKIQSPGGETVREFRNICNVCEFNERFRF